MQDIAGCRIVVADINAQDQVVPQLVGLFEKAAVFDRRVTPSHGYRAVHVVARSLDLPIEIQVRTNLQHTWSEVSEKLSDIVDPAAKYGGGPIWVQECLKMTSELGARIEVAEKEVCSRLVRREAAKANLTELSEIKSNT